MNKSMRTIATCAFLLVLLAQNSFVTAQSEGDAVPAVLSTFSSPLGYRECLPKPDCPAQAGRFYTADGSCNNPLDGAIGQVGRPHKRLVPAAYSDGKNEPRRNTRGDPLPSARKVSADMQDTGTPKSTLHTHTLVIWGQFLAHDVTLTPLNEVIVDCADCSTNDPICYNIAIPSYDQIRGEGKDRRECLPLVRTQPVPDLQCSPDTIREQPNDLTPYIDAGTVYGNSEARFMDLLDNTSDVGKLKVGELEPYGHATLQDPALPLQSQVKFRLHEEDCPAHLHKPTNTSCFVAGDDRVNENTALSSFHTLFLRFHNKIVDGLFQINPKQSRQERIETARLIVSAVTQRITYAEFLPEVLGSDYMKRFDLELADKGYWHGYDASFDATTSNAFATAAMRFGHTLVTSPLTRPNYEYKEPQGSALELKNLFFNAEPLFTTANGGANSILRGLTTDATEIVDTSFVSDLHDFLFAPSGQFGEDLMARNLQRGRDHGLPGYNSYREFCGLKRAKFFNNFEEIAFTPRKRLQTLYRKVDDVDLFIAGLAESPVQGGLFGPTFSCILGYQYRDIRKGDRLWHENGGGLAVFTPDQLQAIRNFTLSRLLCVLDDMASVQPNPFRLSSLRGNERTYCEPNIGMSLNAWKTPSFSALQTEISTETTQWFPSIYRTNVFGNSERLLNYLLQIRPDDVCEDPVGSEERTIQGNKQFRYSCPSGTIRGTDYPNADVSRGSWSAWENYRQPLLPNKNTPAIEPPRTCFQPIAIQVFTKNGIPARKSGEVFVQFSATSGFACRGKDQPVGSCQAYKVRFFCKAIKSDKSTE